jgi:serine/threonine protein kinase
LSSDIKPENILLREKHNDTVIKLADFGFASKVRRRRHHR